MATITFLPNQDGNKQALQFLKDIQKKGIEGNKYYETLAIYITRGLDYLRKHGVTINAHLLCSRLLK